MQTPLAISASVLVLLLWLLTRRRPSGAAAAAGVLASPLSAGLVVRSSVATVAGTSSALPLPSAVALGRSDVASTRTQRLRGLSRQLNGTQEQRLLALGQLDGWRDRAVLPLLHRALRDPHLSVAGAAAAAIASYRGRSTTVDLLPLGSPAGRQRLPRNAAPTV